MIDPQQQAPATSTHEAEILRLTEALGQRDALLASVMSSSGDCVKILDRDCLLTAMNEPGQRLLGICDLHPHLNTCWVDWWTGPEHGKATAAIAAAQSGQVGRFVGFARTPGGDDKWWDVVVTAIRGPFGGLDGYLSVSRDITEAKAGEDRLREARDAAEAANRSKDHFLAVLSHELRTPLSPVLNTAQVMELDPDLPEEVRQAFSMIRRNVELEARLIDDLLDMTRISRDKLALATKVIDVHESLRHVVEMLRGDVDSSGLTLAIEPDAGRYHMLGDSTRLAQVFWNLVKNAIKFTPAGGTVRVVTSNTPDGRLAIRVVDTGIGIDAALLPKLFDAFEQGGRDVTRLFGGLGLGLSISKALVDLHGGTLTVWSEGKGKGAEFTVTVDTVTETAAPVIAHKPARSVGDCRILLVEDHIDTARAMARLLAAEGHGVHTAHTIAAALDAVATGPFDVLVSDLGLPDGSGLDLMRQLRDRYPIKGIALTGYGMDADVARTRDAGFVEHLVKPVNVSQLATAINRVTRGRC